MTLGGFVDELKLCIQSLESSAYNSGSHPSLNNGIEDGTACDPITVPMVPEPTYRNGSPRWAVCGCGMNMIEGKKCSRCGYTAVRPSGPMAPNAPGWWWRKVVGSWEPVRVDLIGSLVYSRHTVDGYMRYRVEDDDLWGGPCLGSPKDQQREEK